MLFVSLSMKRISALFLSLLCALIIQAQGLAVESFRLLETDLTANTAGTKEIDSNGDVAALIKVVTTETGFVFDCGQLGIVKTVQTPGEIWVYVPRRVQKLIVKHPQLGVLRDYYFPIPIQGARTYELVLSSGTVQTVVKKARTSQYVVFQMTPPNAVVMLDGEMLSTADGTATKMMKFGTYDYRVQAPDYLPAVGKVTVNNPKQKHVVNVTLKPNFSQVTLTVDNNAEIWVNGERKGAGSWTGNLGAGTYELETRLANHRPVTATRDIAASDKPLTIRLDAPTPIYGEADINSSPAMADIYVDGSKVGQTPQLVSQLLIGQHQVRLARQGYADYNGTITIREGETTPVSATLSNATTITISSTNPQAALYIDGVAQGTASGQKQTSFGEHQVRLVSEGWREYTGTIHVTEQQRTFNLPMEEIVQSRRTINVGNVSFTMIRVDGGTFQMGATKEMKAPYEDEKPVHQVTLSSYYIGETEVTQALWQEVMGTTVQQQRDKADTSWPMRGEGADYPMYYVSWEECQEFISRLNQKTGLNFRLPTEAEWEFAARGGTKSRGYQYSGSNNLNDVAWFTDNSSSSTHPVKTKQPNELGIYDMSGNVWEWCQDWYGSYSKGVQTNPTGSSSGSNRVCRGGSWSIAARYCRSSGRLSYTPSYRGNFLGLRLSL